MASGNIKILSNATGGQVEPKKNINGTLEGKWVKDHNRLTNRDLNDQHPISAITGLEDTLDTKLNSETVTPIIERSITRKATAAWYDKYGRYGDCGWWFLSEEVPEGITPDRSILISGPYLMGNPEEIPPNQRIVVKNDLGELVRFDANGEVELEAGNNVQLEAINDTNAEPEISKIIINAKNQKIKSGGTEFADSAIVDIIADATAADNPIEVVGDSENNTVVIKHASKTPITPAAVKVGYDAYGHVNIGNPLKTSDLENDSNFVNGSELSTALDTKVNKVAGKDLSTNDFTDELKNKLDSIASGAEANVQADWNEKDSTKDSYIRNKPNLDNYATDDELQQALANKQDIIADLADIRAGATLGSTALQEVPSNYVTDENLDTKLQDYAAKADLKAVATSGSYNDLIDKPTIPEKVSDLTNDSGFITPSALNGYATEEYVQNQGYITGIDSTDVITALGYTPGTSNFDGDYNGLTNKPTLGTLASKDTVDYNTEVTNKPDLTIYATNEALNNGLAAKQDTITDLETIRSGAEKGSTAVQPGALATVATSGNYNDLNDKPVIPVVPTKVSAFENDAGYLTEHQSLADYAKTSYVDTELAKKQDVIEDLATIRSGANAGATAVQPSSLSTVATSGSYNDLIDKPNIPTKTSDLTNDGDGESNFATESWVLANGGSVASIEVDGQSYTPDANKIVHLPDYPTLNSLGAQDKLSFDETYDASTNKAATVKSITDRITALDIPGIKSKISNIENIIPAEATESNKLADKDFVNSSIATATANFKGTFNVVTALGLTLAATETQIATALATKITNPTPNDYAYVSFPDPVVTTVITKFDRYKYSDNIWGYEYTLNNSSFTAEQWAAINSGITATLVADIGNNTTARHTHSNKTVLDGITSADITAWNAKYDKPDAGIPKTDLETSVQASLNKADTALQEHQSITTGNINGTINVAGEDVAVRGLGSNAYTNTPIPVSDSDLNNNRYVNYSDTQQLDDTQKSTARNNIGAGTSNFSGNYDDLIGAPTLGALAAKDKVDYETEITNTPDLSIYATNTSLNEGLGTKQDVIDDLATIRSGAEAGSTAVQPADLATVATSGSYNDLTDKPTLGALASKDSVDYETEVTGKPNLATVATSGNYNDLENKPDLSIYAQSSTLATVATTGNYNDLTNKPTLGSLSDQDTVDYETEVTNKPDLSIYAQSASLATVATSGSYNDLIDKPNIPTKDSDLTNDKYVIYTDAQTLTEDQKAQVRSNLGVGSSSFSGDYNDLANKPTLGALAAKDTVDYLTDITNTPNLATVATSGSYNDLSNTPVIPTAIVEKGAHTHDVTLNLPTVAPTPVNLALSPKTDTFVKSYSTVTKKLATEKIAGVHYDASTTASKATAGTPVIYGTADVDNAVEVMTGFNNSGVAYTASYNSSKSSLRLTSLAPATTSMTPAKAADTSRKITPYTFEDITVPIATDMITVATGSLIDGSGADAVVTGLATPSTGSAITEVSLGTTSETSGVTVVGSVAVSSQSTTVTTTTDGKHSHGFEY